MTACRASGLEIEPQAPISIVFWFPLSLTFIAFLRSVSFIGIWFPVSLTFIDT
jgi:hypothetical protein